MTAPAYAEPVVAGWAHGNGVRLWFGLDAVVTGGNAVAYLALAAVLTDWLGAESSTYRWLGVALAGFTLALAAVAGGMLRPGTAAWLLVAANAAWSLGSLVVAATGALGFEPLGRGWVLAQAVVVLAFALLQARALLGGQGGKQGSSGP